MVGGRDGVVGGSKVVVREGAEADAGRRETRTGRTPLASVMGGESRHVGRTGSVRHRHRSRSRATKSRVKV